MKKTSLLSFLIILLFMNQCTTLIKKGKDAYFITIWKTDNDGISGDNQIILPLHQFLTNLLEIGMLLKSLIIEIFLKGALLKKITSQKFIK